MRIWFLILKSLLFVIIKNTCKLGKKIIAEWNISTLNQIPENTPISMIKMLISNTRQEYSKLFRNKLSVRKKAVLPIGLSLSMNNKEFKRTSVKGTLSKTRTINGFLRIKYRSNQHELLKIFPKILKIILKTQDSKRKLIGNPFMHKWRNHLLLLIIINKISLKYRQWIIN